MTRLHLVIPALFTHRADVLLCGGRLLHRPESVQPLPAHVRASDRHARASDRHAPGYAHRVGRVRHHAEARHRQPQRSVALQNPRRQLFSRRQRGNDDDQGHGPQLQLQLRLLGIQRQRLLDAIGVRVVGYDSGPDVGSPRHHSGGSDHLPERVEYRPRRKLALRRRQRFLLNRADGHRRYDRRPAPKPELHVPGVQQLNMHRGDSSGLIRHGVRSRRSGGVNHEPYADVNVYHILADGLYS